MGTNDERQDLLYNPQGPLDTSPEHIAYPGDWIRNPPSIARHQGPVYNQDESTITVGQGQWFNGTASIFDRQPGYPVHAIVVDNYTNQFVWLGASVDRFIPPYTIGRVIRVLNAVNTVHAEFTAPPGEVQAAPVVGQTLKLAWYEAWLPEQSGLTYNGGSAPLVPTSFYGSAVAPGAGGVIVNAPGPISGGWPPGFYHLVAAVRYGGTADVIDNMKLVLANIATITTLMVNPVVNGTPIIRSIDYEIVPGTAPNPFQIQAIAAGGAGSVFTASLDVIPISSLA